MPFVDTYKVGQLASIDPMTPSFYYFIHSLNFCRDDILHFTNEEQIET